MSKIGARFLNWEHKMYWFSTIYTKFRISGYTMDIDVEGFAFMENNNEKELFYLCSMKHDFAGVVLAGGNSSRMGKDKAWLLYQGKPFIQHAIDALSPHCSQLFISSNDSSYSILGLEQIPDMIPGYGPAGALLSCLSAVRPDSLMVLPCDLPLITHSVMMHFLLESKECDAVVAKVNGLLIPVCGVYHKSALAFLSTEVAEGRLKMKGILKGLKVQFVDFDLLGLENRFFNVNNDEDYKLLQGFSL